MSCISGTADEVQSAEYRVQSTGKKKDSTEDVGRWERKMSQSYRDLIAWQKAVDMVEAVYCASKAFPDHEPYALTRQLHRAAISVPSNIAEGHSRFSQRDFRHFLRQSRGSLAEVETQLELACRLGYIHGDELRPLIQRTDEVSRVLTGLINSLPLED